MLGSAEKKIYDAEKNAKLKMGKSLYAKSALPAGHVLSAKDIAIKSPAGGLEPYDLEQVIGKKLKVALEEEMMILLQHLQ